ncbi:hypothetical protein MKW92_014646 [Papaver armeniacum]|nr:hypothetical protein MKW92_014646 [Papaver armeniacum]
MVVSQGCTWYTSVCISLSLMAQETAEEQKWKGKACTNLKDITAEEIWPFFEDFLSINKWLPGVDACTLVEGVSGEPGCVRYCTGTAVPADGSDDESVISWVKEKLLSIDPVERCISYEVIEGNVGFESYIATIKVFSDSSDQGTQENGQSGSMIEWGYIVNPIPGWKSEDLASYIDATLLAMAKRMEEALLQAKS